VVTDELQRRDIPSIGASLLVPATWEDLSDDVDDVVAAWGAPFEPVAFRSNVVVTQDQVPADTPWATLAEQTWQAMGAMLTDAHLVDETQSDASLVRWVHHRVAEVGVVLHQVTLRQADRVITTSVTVPVLALPDVVDAVREVAAGLRVDREAQA
jgi:hypothetical protein